MSAEYSLEWVDKAEGDFAAALDLSRRRKYPLPDQVCFFSQQCAEKYLKAFLAAREMDVPRVHDLRHLNTLCMELEPVFGALTEPLKTLEPYAVEIRCPGESASPEEAREAVAAVKQVRRFVRAQLGLE